ncbi:MAG: EAL domain-containing protein, partial [Variibacter sp.]|nr:EAL domain-containing protein [Variibacter sp.]
MPLAVLVMVAALGCAALGYHFSRLTETRHAVDQHRPWRAALDELRPALSPDTAPAVVPGIERPSGLPDLRHSPAPDRAGQDRHFAHDDDGRFIGWLNWDPEGSPPELPLWLWPLAAIIFGALALFAGFAIARLRRALRELAASNARANRLANEDTLTGLPHHRAMLESLDASLAARKPQEVVAFAFFDLDNFKVINDVQGRETGDQVLAAVAERLKAVMPRSAIAGRFGGDEFALIAVGEDEDVAVGSVYAVGAALGRPCSIGGRAIHLGVTGGYALAPRDSATRDDLTRRAHLALRAAKHNRRGETLGFVPAMDTDFADRRFIEQELRLAMAANHLELHYQPIVTASGSGMVGVEALLRWRHPQRGQIAPLEFVPVAEQSGLMTELGQFVLQRALSDAKRWPELFIAVNLSPVQVRDPTLVDAVARLLAESGIAPSRLVLEITEGVLIDNPEEARVRLDALRALGIRLALDDFGTGYSSLSYLQRFPFDKLKVDKSFVAPLGHSANAGAMIQAIVSLGRALGLSVLVEGVETEEQRVLLRLAGCDEMQGYRFARPTPP